MSEHARLLELSERSLQYLDNTLATSRWRLGNKLISVANTLAFRGKANADIYDNMIELRKQISEFK